MHSPGPAFLIREARSRDQAKILKLARELDSINLPADSAELRDALSRSALSFRGRCRRRERAVYVFCAEELATHRIAGASMIIGKHGTPESPHYYLEMGREERCSRTLKRMFRHTYLQLRYSMDGPTELGGLIVAAPMRRHPERIGKQLSWARFLYLAKHRARFEPRVLAEMLPEFGPDYRNAFWDHFGRELTGLSFRAADRLAIHDKEFIRALFPAAPLYTFLLPEEVRKSLGQAAPTARGAVRLLEQAGMKFLGHIDPFDAGPYYGAAVEDLAPVREYRRLKAVAGAPDPARSRPCLVAREDRSGFRAARADAVVVEEDSIMVAADILRALGAKERDPLDTVPLP